MKQLTILALLTIGSAFAADANTDFSISNGNPNGAWSYGYTTTLGGSLIYHSQALANWIQPGLNGWTTDLQGTGTPSIAKNTNATTVAWSSVIIDPGQLTMHPGPNGEFSILRYTASVAGTYQYSAAFIGQDWIFPTNSDAHIQHNGSDLWTDDIVGFSATAGTSGQVVLGVGDTLDVALGRGPNQSYFGDTTGVEFSVEAVPEPATLAVLGAALAGFRRRRK